MRLIRIGEPASQVADDVRASLTALGRGPATIGGVAVIDVTPDGSQFQFEAVVVTPYGIVIVAGVDLPGPALRLEAPLRGVWKADNWPLVGSGSAINPGTAALAAAGELAAKLNALTNMAIPVGLVLAVGPFVDNVVTVPLPGESVRVVHPTPARLRDALGSLAPDDGLPCSVEQARAVLRLIDPNVPIQNDDALTREGFVTGVTGKAVAHATAAAPAPARLAAQAPDERPTELMQLPLPAEQPEAERRKSEVRVLPLAAVLLLVAGVVAAIAMAAGGATGSPPDRKEPPKSSRHAIEGVQYTEVTTAAQRDCAARTYGDVQASLQKTPCAGMQLGSFRASVDGKQAAVSVAVIEFGQAAPAKLLHKVADTEGSGGAQDIATVQRKWPDQPPSFDNAAYRTEVDGNQVRLVQATWLGRPSSPDDKTLARIARTAFEIPLTD